MSLIHTVSPLRTRLTLRWSNHSTSALRDWRVQHGHGFWLVAFAFTVTVLGGTLPAPLYPLYQQRDHFQSGTLTLIFTAYAVGVLVALLTLGHTSDLLGRRAVPLPAIALSAASSVAFLLTTGIPWLLAARFVSGLSVGLLTSAATTHLAELHAAARPAGSPGRAVLIATAANIGGLGLGPLLAGALAELSSSPLRAPYITHLITLALAAAAVWVCPETRDRRHGRLARLQALAVPRDLRSTFIACSSAAFAAFAVLGLFSSLAPILLSGLLGQPSRLLAGVVAFAVFAAAAGGQITLGRLRNGTALRVGVAILPLGLTTLAAAVPLRSLTVFLIGGVVAGLGAGLTLKGGVATVAGRARNEEKAQALAAFFTVAYLGLTVPVIGLGLALQATTPTRAVTSFTAILAVVTAWSARTLARSTPTTDSSR